MKFGTYAGWTETKDHSKVCPCMNLCWNFADCAAVGSVHFFIRSCCLLRRRLQLRSVCVGSNSLVVHIDQSHDKSVQARRRCHVHRGCADLAAVLQCCRCPRLLCVQGADQESGVIHVCFCSLLLVRCMKDIEDVRLSRATRSVVALRRPSFACLRGLFRRCNFGFSRRSANGGGGHLRRRRRRDCGDTGMPLLISFCATFFPLIHSLPHCIIANVFICRGASSQPSERFFRSQRNHHPQP